ncbi:hypothetical protein ACH5AO_20265 [Streptomyces sp. NPDC018964]|uniref:hypothetical protein n=1 Tax=unclassified Streptomyces TaxID=2593676 RepID=UPI0037AFE5EA
MGFADTAVVIPRAVEDGAGARRGHARHADGPPRGTGADPRAPRRPGTVREVRAPAMAPGDTTAVTE